MVCQHMLFEQFDRHLNEKQLHALRMHMRDTKDMPGACHKHSCYYM